MRTYSRKLEDGSRNETWSETCARTVNGALEIGAKLTDAEAEKLFDHMFNLRCLPAGRALWQLGTPLVRKFSGTSLNNCYFTNIEKIEDFELLFDYLMLG
ncbi:MAG: ribonucleoside-triphosphate reductase, adenosylcobalamin-dependent, partial [Gammaproteobacteria bacterium]|nr:ribonucleoside-triphosphate reductase, adenosylcobalamin-dependent [Gammaproteobacteria bacterium]